MREEFVEFGTGTYFRSHLPTLRNAQIENRFLSRIPRISRINNADGLFSAAC
jgi:hypothetical protein